MDLNQKSKQVWQRVLSEKATADASGLPALIAEEKADAVTYLQLSHRIGGRDGAMLRRMFEQEQVHISCLKGIYRMYTGTRCSVHTAQPPQEAVCVTLRRCYGREMRSLAAYEARSADPEYGSVFARLAAQEREHCQNILAIMGRLEDQ